MIKVPESVKDMLTFVWGGGVAFINNGFIALWKNSQEFTNSGCLQGEKEVTG